MLLHFLCVITYNLLNCRISTQPNPLKDSRLILSSLEASKALTKIKFNKNIMAEIRDLNLKESEKKKGSHYFSIVVV